MRRLVKVFSWWAASWEIQIYPFSNKLSPSRYHPPVGVYFLAMEDRLLRIVKIWKADLAKLLKMMFGIAFKTGICVSAEQQYILQPRRFIFCSPVINCTYFRESMWLEGSNTVFSSFPLNDLTKDFVNERQEKESECALCFYLFIFYLLLIY